MKILVSVCPSPDNPPSLPPHPIQVSPLDIRSYVIHTTPHHHATPWSPSQSHYAQEFLLCHAVNCSGYCGIQTFDIGQTQSFSWWWCGGGVVWCGVILREIICIPQSCLQCAVTDCQLVQASPVQSSSVITINKTEILYFNASPTSACNIEGGVVCGVVLVVGSVAGVCAVPCLRCVLPLASLLLM